MPTVPRGNTNIPTIMLAEKISARHQRVGMSRGDAMTLIRRCARRAAAAHARGSGRRASVLSARFRELGIDTERHSLARRSAKRCRSPARRTTSPIPRRFACAPDDLPPDFSAEERVLWDVAYTTGTTSGRPSPFYNTAHDAYAIWEQARRCNEAEGLALRRPRRQPLSARGLSDRRVPQRRPLRHDRRASGGARPYRRGANPSSRCAIRCAEALAKIARFRPTVLWGVPSFIRRFLDEAQRRGVGSLRRAAGPDLGRAGACGAAGELRKQLARLGAAVGRRSARAMRSPRCRAAWCSAPRRREAAEPLPRPLLSRSGRSRDRPPARRRRERHAGDHPSAPPRHRAAALSGRRHRHAVARAVPASAGGRASAWSRRRAAPATWSNAAACWSTPT